MRSLRCAAPQGPAGCQGAVQAHHAGTDHGLGQKPDDTTAVPLCRLHHRSWHDGRGVFLTWDKATRRAWAEVVVRETQSMWLAEAPTRGSA